MRHLALANEYSLWDRLRYRRGGAFSLAHLWDEVMTVDLPAEIPAVKVPVTFCLGRHDWVTPSTLAADYLEALQAPDTRGIWFEKSAHCAHWEEPEVFRQVLLTALESRP